jgi:4-hydroxybenzoate polyprenyltransferase
VPAVADLAELVRAPAGLSVPGDVVLGAVTGNGTPVATATGVAGSLCLYYAGMAANDVFDRGLDAKERPERPIPSGRVSVATATALAAGLTAAGVALAGSGRGRRGVARVVPLAAAIWAYDARLKHTRAGPAAMAACRTLDVLLGAGTSPGSTRRALPRAGLVGAHTWLITMVSANEVEGGDRRPAVLAATGAAGITLAGGASWALPGSPRTVTARVVSALLLAVYAVLMGRATAAAVRDPIPANQQAVVGTGIRAMIPLDAALAAGAGRVPAGLGIAALLPLAAALRKGRHT